jgi:hypothetical protein
VFFCISHSGNGQWITRVCNDETRASLLPGVDLHVYGNPVHMLPTEDFLSPCILVNQLVVESFAWWESGGHFTGVSNSGHWKSSKPLRLQQWHDPHHCSEHHHMAHVTSHNDTIIAACAQMLFAFQLSQNQGQGGWCSDAPKSLCLLA